MTRLAPKYTVGVGDVLAPGLEHLGGPVHLVGGAGPVDAVEDQVEVLAPQVIHPILLPEVDDAAGAQVHHPMDATRRHRHRHGSTLAVRHLDGQVARTTISAKHQHLGVFRNAAQPLALCGAAFACEERLVSRQPGQRQAGNSGEHHILGHLGNLVLGADAILRKGSGGAEGGPLLATFLYAETQRDLIADLQLRAARAQRGHLPGHIETWHEGERVDGKHITVASCDDLHIDGVGARKVHAHERLAPAGGGHRDVVAAQPR
mmetsp:Transcript_52725/g.170194  ORF Transcript_52725/g.170194 Transcript_52725/m.170194 type:complete len:262 (-) Transcript_52725:160-945(-)